MLLPRFLDDDIFLSYSRGDGALYAAGLADKLTAKKYSCFIDKLDAEPDEDLPESLKQKIRRCAVVVVVGTPKAAISQFVEKEIATFKPTRRRILLIDFDGSVGRARWYPLIAGLPAEPEGNHNALPAGEPSSNVVGYIEKSFNYTRRNQRMARTVWASLFVFLVLVTLSVGAFVTARNQLRRATAATRLADDEARRAESATTLATSKTREAARAMAAERAAKSELAVTTTSLDVATRRAEEKTREAEEQAKRAREAGDEAAHQQQKANALQQESTMLQYRNAAQERLVDDPVLAYRLAERAHALKSDAVNKKLIRSALSKIDLHYRTQVSGRSIEHFTEPFILLAGPGGTDYVKSYHVFDTTAMQEHTTPLRAHSAWVIPVGKTWRLLSLNWVGEGMDAVANYRLWDNRGVALSEEIASARLKKIKFINPTTVTFPLWGEAATLTWDLASNERRKVERRLTDDSNTHFYNIYGSLDTRPDGISAAHYANGLVLVSETGDIDKGSYTPVSFDPAFSSGRWSPDGRYFALRYAEQHRLGIWDPKARSFIWLDPDGWVAESYAWSNGGHILAFSGRTSNQTDVTVELVDASAVKESRRIIHRGEVPVRNIAFLPDDGRIAINDRDKNLMVISIAKGESHERGFHRNVDELFSSPSGFYTSTGSEFRRWSSAPAPAKHWNFLSDGKRVYRADGAADASWRWLAVPFVDEERRGGIEVRHVETGERVELDAPLDLSMDLVFTTDGRWLVFVTTNLVRFYATATWQHHDVRLQEGDGQFFSLRVDKDNVYAHVLGKGLGSDARYDYAIRITGDTPQMVLRIKVDRTEYRSDDRKTLSEEIDGWDTGTLYRYRSAGLLSVSDSGWAYYAKCRDQALGASDCDVQFVPRDIDRLMKLYDTLLWDPAPEELAAQLR